MSENKEVAQETNKKITMRDCVCFLIGVIVGIVVAFALTTSAVKSSVENTNLGQADTVAIEQAG